MQTPTVNDRIKGLKRLYAAITARCEGIEGALRADFNKDEFDTYATEVGCVLAEIRYFIRHLKRLARPKRVRTGVVNFPAYGRVYPEPYGRVLVVAPWNYPFQLAMTPLAGAYAAGNRVVVKPSAKTSATAEIIGQIVAEVFAENEVKVDMRREVIGEKFDYIFFTGGVETGREIMKKAAESLTPLTLELGGKSPCVIDKSADIRTAARRLAWGKFLNAGQTCVAPDYVLVHKDIKEEFLAAFFAEIDRQYYTLNADGSLTLNDFPYVINAQKADEVGAMLQNAKILKGGKIEGRLIEPTVVEADYGSPIMQAEVFAPVCPVLTFDTLDEAAERIEALPRPLALYYFGKEAGFVRRLSFGGGCVNDVIMHLTEEGLPFGGVGQSGMGSYHGKKSFETFSHYKSVLFKGRAELMLKYKPHGKKDAALVKKVFK